MPTDIAEYLKAARKKELDAYIGTPTIDHTIEIIRTEIEIGRAVFETAGDPVPRAPFVRTSAANCSPQAISETLSIQVSESQTTSWTFSCEASLSETAEFSIGGDLIVAGASAKASVTVGVKVSTQVSNSSTKQVALTDSWRNFVTASLNRPT